MHASAATPARAGTAASPTLMDKQKLLKVPAGMAALGLCLVITGCGRGEARSVQPEGGTEPAAVRVTPVGLRPMERTVTVLGSLMAMDWATLSIKTSGRLKTLNVDVGSTVKAGDVLAQVEPRDYELRLQQAEALLAQARARVGLPLEGDDDTVDIEKISTVREARALLEEAERNLERIKSLNRERIISAAELERAEAEYVVMENRYVDALQDARERCAVLAQRRAELNIARQQLIDTTLRAPFDGAVQERLTNVGEFLSAGSPVVTIVRTDPVRVRAEIPEREAHLVQEGQPIRMYFEGETNVYTGKLVRVSPAIDQRTRVLRVEGEIPNPGHLRPGRFARVEIIVEPAAPALAIPEDAVVTFAGTRKALVVSTDRAEERRLTLGRRQGAWLEVLDGLEQGDRVIREPGGLEAGDPVRIVEEEPTASS